MKAENFKIGTKFRYMGITCHCRGHVDGMVVFRFWSKSKQKWHYKCEPYYIIDMFRHKKPAN